MAQSNDMETPNFADNMRKIRILIFASHKKSLLYSGYKEDKFNNWKLAEDFAQANGMFPIQETEGGKYLSDPDRRKKLKYEESQITNIWNRASVKYCVNIEGSVKTFVCGAWDRSTFRRKEIHAMLKSKTINDINGRDHESYVRLRRAVMNRLNEDGTLPRPQRHARAINAVFRSIAFQEIRQDLAIAREQNNQEEVRSVLARVGHLRNQHLDELKRMPLTQDAKKLAESLAAEEEITQANPGLHFPRYAHG